jgi:hypothetical protein
VFASGLENPQILFVPLFWTEVATFFLHVTPLRIGYGAG